MPEESMLIGFQLQRWKASLSAPYLCEGGKTYTC